MKYELITGQIDNLSETVNRYIEMGYKPVGQAFVIEERKKKNALYGRFDYYKILGQPMVKEDVN